MAENHDRIWNHLRCKAMTVAGAQCKNRTIKSEYCWVHLKKLQNLRVKPSEIFNSDFGLFVTKSIKPREKIVEYSGTKYDTPVDGKYVLEVSKNKFIDANLSKFVGGFSNDCRPADKRSKFCKGNNSHFRE